MTRVSQRGPDCIRVGPVEFVGSHGPLYEPGEDSVDWDQGHEILGSLARPRGSKGFHDPPLGQVDTRWPPLGAMGSFLALQYFYHWKRPVSG